MTGATWETILDHFSLSLILLKITIAMHTHPIQWGKKNKKENRRSRKKDRKKNEKKKYCSKEKEKKHIKIWLPHHYKYKLF